MKGDIIKNCISLARYHDQPKHYNSNSKYNYNNSNIKRGYI